MRSFEYIRPESLEEACHLLNSQGSKVSVLAGGTDILVQIKKGAVFPQKLISLKEMSELSQMRSDPSGLVIGAMTSIAGLIEDENISGRFPAIAEAAKLIGSPQVRNRATIGGNICNGSPAADMVPILLVYDASLVIRSEEGERAMPLRDFFKGPGQTRLGAGEILKEVHVPAQQPHCFATYLKAYRSRMDCALTGVALYLSFIPESQKCFDMRIALGAVAPTPILLKRLESIVLDSNLDCATIDKIVQEACTQAAPITDIRATASYRRKLVGVLTRRALLAARKAIQQGAPA